MHYFLYWVALTQQQQRAD